LQGGNGEGQVVELLQGRGLDPWAAQNLVRYLREQMEATGRLPDDRTVVLEQFRDELGDWQLVLLSPFGARVHAPWALAISARLAADLGIDVQVMHADDGIVMRIPDTDDEELLTIVRHAVLTDVDDVERQVTDALGGSALFAARFRECASRALLLPRRDPRRRAPLWQQRQRSAQLLTLAAQHPRFPISLETMRECLQDVYDLPGLRTVLTGLHSGTIRLHEVHTDGASPYASSLLFGYIAAFMYEGDAPLAERRAQALSLDTALLSELLGSEELRSLLDPDALAEVEDELGWHSRPLRDLEDLADALRHLGPLREAEIVIRGGDLQWGADLVAARRALWLTVGETRLVAIEDAARIRDALGVALPPGLPSSLTEPVTDPMADLIARYARTHGPFSSADVAEYLAIGPAIVERELRRLTDAGRLRAGEFRPGGSGAEWVDPEVLRRVRRRSVAKLRAQAEPVEQRDYARFLPEWHGLDSPRRGVDGVYAAIEQLAGVPQPASALETSVLPLRVRDYRPEMLDELTAGGEVVWAGAGPLPGGDGWLVLAPVDAGFLINEPPEPEDPMARAVLAALSDGSGWFAGQLLERVSASTTETVDPDRFGEVLKDLMWSGAVRNDTLAPVRQALRGSAGKNRQRSSTRSRRRSRPGWSTASLASLREAPSRRSLGLPGRWSAVPRSTLEPTAKAAATVPWILARHGVLTRGAMGTERFPGGFAAAYRVLSAMEEAGKALRSYAIEGLGGAQFSTVPTIDRLRHRAQSHVVDAAPHVVSATDPAQPFGAALPWPERAIGLGAEPAHRPGRKTGAFVVLDDGRPTLYVEKGGRSLLTFAPEESMWQRAVEALAGAVSAGTVPGLNVQRCDGRDIHSSPLAPVLTAAGFRTTPSGLRLRAG